MQKISKTILLNGSARKLSRERPGISYLPFDVKLAFIEASEGKIGPYNHDGGKTNA